MTKPTASKTARQSDALFWIAGAAIAAVGTAWLVILQPWAGGPATVPALPPLQLATAVPNETAADTPDEDSALPPADAPSAFDDPLHMAQLAYEAGMLVEPEQYSAWTLYAQVLKSQPGNAAALQGLTKVADDLVQRGETALEQGRFDDARTTIDRIRALLPAHAGAKALAEKVWPAAHAAAGSDAEDSFKPELPAAPTRPPRVAPVQVTPTPEEPAKPKPDPIVEAQQAFASALNEGRLLTPPERSAKHFVETMIAANPTHAATRESRQKLAVEFLARAAQAQAAQDIEAAGIWIDQAETVALDLAGVNKARSALIDQEVAIESAKRVPASVLKVVSYAPPEYPERLVQRGVTGWVDVEFTVRADGTTGDITVVDASSATFFRKEAIAAVEKWRFEPRIFMNRPIQQRTYTRIRFVQ